MVVRSAVAAAEKGALRASHRRKGTRLHRGITARNRRFEKTCGHAGGKANLEGVANVVRTKR